MFHDILHRLPFINLPLPCLLPLWVGYSETALIAFALAVVLRVFGLRAGFHRLFSYLSYKISRVFQCILATLDTKAAEQVPLWWVGHHRDHYKHSDTHKKAHSLLNGTFRHDLVDWLSEKNHFKTPYKNVPNWMDFKKLAQKRFFWRDVGLTHIGLKLLSLFELIWDLKTHPQPLLLEQKT